MRKNIFYNLIVVSCFSFWSSSFACNAEVDINKLSKSLEKVGLAVQKVMSNVPSDATKVLFLGTTGSGKSTIINNLMGSKLKVKDGGIGVILDPVTPVPGFEVGHSSISETTIPNAIYSEQDNLVYCDCPGFGDTRGAEQEILNAFAIDQLLSSSDGKENKAKILLVMSAREVTAGRGESAKRIFDEIVQMIPDEKKLKKSVVLLLRDADKRSKDGFFKYLEEDKSRKNYLVSYLKDHSSTHVFNVPPISMNQLDEEIDIYDKERLVELLQQNPVINIPHDIILNTKECIYILNLFSKIGKPEEIIRTLSKKISDLLNNEDDLEKINNIGEFLNEINIDINSPVDFINLFKEKQNYISEFNIMDVVNQMQKFDALYSFIKQVLEKIKSSEEASMYIDFSSIINDYCDIAKVYTNVISDMQLAKKSREEFIRNKLDLESIRKANEEVKLTMEKYKEDHRQKEVEYNEKIETLKNEVKLGKLSQEKYEIEANEARKKVDEVYSENEELKNMTKMLQQRINDTESLLKTTKDESKALTVRQNEMLENMISQMQQAKKAMANPSWKEIFEAIPAVTKSLAESAVVLTEAGCVVTKVICDGYAYCKSMNKR